MASFDASEAQTEQVGRVASLENTMGGVMAELHRLQSLVAQQAQHAQNAHYTQNDGLQYVPPPLVLILIFPNLPVSRASHVTYPHFN